MSEIWNHNSSIEQKHSITATSQLSQLKAVFSVREIYDIINKYQKNHKIDDNDYNNLVWFIDSKYAEKYVELINYIKALFGEELKDKYFEIQLNNNKDKLKSHTYDLIYKYFFENKLDININIFKDELYQTMVKLPKIFANDMLSQSFRKKIEDILSLEEIKQKDQEATKLNKKDIEISNILYQKKLTNENLKKTIYQNIPTDFSDLEKSIYIYIKLCQYLSYDPNYFTNKNLYKNIHEEFENTSKIGSNTNYAICYEFTTIYSEMLKDMGKEVSVTTKLDMDETDKGEFIFTNYADSHANLKYVVDNIIVSADATLSILNGDLINAKMQNKLNGLQCLNVEPEAKKQFDDALNKVYNNLKLPNSLFKKYHDDVVNKPLVDKLKILFDDISDKNFSATDFVSYITNIKHELFTTNELDWNLKINYIGKNNNHNQYPVVLFLVNTNDIKNAQEDTVQYLYDPLDKKITKMTKEELEKMFSEGKLFFIDEQLKIPNIDFQKNHRL